MNQIRIAGIGEILMDIFVDGTATVGGAPINVAFHAHQLLTATGRGRGEMISAVGDDDWGRHILKWLRSANLSTEFVATKALYATGTATVFVKDGEAGFDIAADAAWDHVAEDTALQKLARECSAVAFGSLAQRTLGAGCAIRRFVAAVSGPRLYDVNLRSNTTDGAKGYSEATLLASCSVATIVKANSGELDEVARLLDLPHTSSSSEARLWDQMALLLARYELDAVAITRGSAGTLLLSREGRIQLPDSDLPLREIHPVGAGDAFLPGCSTDCASAALWR